MNCYNRFGLRDTSQATRRPWKKISIDRESNVGVPFSAPFFSQPSSPPTQHTGSGTHSVTTHAQSTSSYDSDIKTTVTALCPSLIISSISIYNLSLISLILLLYNQQPKKAIAPLRSSSSSHNITSITLNAPASPLSNLLECVCNHHHYLQTSPEDNIINLPWNSLFVHLYHVIYFLDPLIWFGLFFGCYSCNILHIYSAHIFWHCCFAVTFFGGRTGEEGVKVLKEVVKATTHHSHHNLYIYY